MLYVGSGYPLDCIDYRDEACHAGGHVETAGLVFIRSCSRYAVARLKIMIPDYFRAPPQPRLQPPQPPPPPHPSQSPPPHTHTHTTNPPPPHPSQPPPSTHNHPLTNPHGKPDTQMRWRSRNGKRICQLENRADCRLAPSQWEISLKSNAVSHWLGANLKSALRK